jgi:hypothetical protein
MDETPDPPAIIRRPRIAIRIMRIVVIRRATEEFTVFGVGAPSAAKAMKIPHPGFETEE